MFIDSPRVSIGLPVYNGEKYLEEALDSLLAQTYGDFELIISDNASTDRTGQICSEYAAKHRRIRYYRNETNLGAAKNFNRVFDLSLGEYFKWAAHDDICAPGFIARCVPILDQDPSIVLCYPKTRIIDHQGRVQRDYDIKVNSDSSRPHERLRNFIGVRHGCYQVFGVMRVSALKMTPLIGNFYASDRNLLARLCLIGRFHEVPEYLFFRRDHPDTSLKAFSIREVSRWYDPTNTGVVSCPHWRNGIEYVRSVQSANICCADRLLCYLAVGKWFLKRRSWLVDDLEACAVQKLGPAPTPMKRIVKALWRSLKLIDPGLRL